MGADPCRKTIAVEVDYMAKPFLDHIQRPTDGMVNQVKGMLDSAPTAAVTGGACPYASPGFPRKATGIDMIIDRDLPDNLIEEQEAMPLEALSLIGLAKFTPDAAPTSPTPCSSTIRPPATTRPDAAARTTSTSSSASASGRAT